MQWKRDLILGLQPKAEVALIVGYRGVSLEVAVGGHLRGEFSLAADPCILVGGEAAIYVSLTAEAWIFEISKKAEFIATLPPCGGAGEGEELFGASPVIHESRGLIPRFITSLPGIEAEGALDGLPDIAYPFAKPSLARHDDGTMTLVYVSEDPSKAFGQHLEVFSSHFDGDSWSAPVQLTNNTLLEDAPSVVYDADGNAIAVWSTINSTLTNPASTDPQTLLEDLEISYSVWDAGRSFWSALKT